LNVYLDTVNDKLASPLLRTCKFLIPHFGSRHIATAHGEDALKTFQVRKWRRCFSNLKQVIVNFCCEDMLQSVNTRWQDYIGNKLSPFPAISKSDIFYFSVIIRKNFAFYKGHFLSLFCMETRGWKKTKIDLLY
jgi:hypothetical protein